MNKRAPPRNKWYRHGLHQCFKFNNIVGKGITELIHQHFFPPNWKLYQMAGKQGQGAKGGCRVDSELKDWIKWQDKPKVALRHLEKYSPYTVQIIRELKRRGLRAVAAQVVVGNVPTRVATAVDLLVADLSGNLGIWEIKSGYADTFEAECPTKMKTPVPRAEQKVAFETLSANPLHFSLVQLILTWILWCRTYPKKRIRHQNACVVNVNATGVKLYSIPPVLGCEIYTQLKIIGLV